MDVVGGRQTGSELLGQGKNRTQFSYEGEVLIFIEEFLYYQGYYIYFYGLEGKREKVGNEDGIEDQGLESMQK